MTINVNRSMNIFTPQSSDNYGTIKLIDNNNTQYDYMITYIFNENIVGKSTNGNNNYIYIKIFNIFSDESENSPQNNGTVSSLVKMYNGDQVIQTFYSFRIIDIKDTQSVQKLLSNGDSYTPKPPEIYDLDAYKTIINKYQYSPNVLRMEYDTRNDTILNVINKNYSSGIIYRIQRVITSITGNKITTAISPSIILPGSKSNNIGTFLIIKSLKSDFDTMSLNSYFKPLSTILYFYKMSNFSTGYSFSDANLYNTPNSTFNLKNNSNNMYQSNIQYNNLNSIKETNTSTYQLIPVGNFTSTDINQEIRVPFSQIYNLF